MTTKKRADDEGGDSAPIQNSSPDVALIHGLTQDGEGFHILRARENRLELGAVRPLREGVPISGEVVTLRPRPNCPVVCDVEVQLKAPELPSDRQISSTAVAPSSAARSGPAQVATDEYRKNWDAIFSLAPGKRKLVN